MERLQNTLPKLEAEIKKSNGVVLVEGKENGEYFHLAISATDDISQIDDHAKTLASVNGQFPLQHREAYGIHALFSVSPNIHIFEKPQPSPASGDKSQSMYWGWSSLQGLLIQINGRWITSTFHGHEGTPAHTPAEIISRVYGETKLSVSKTDKIEDAQELSLTELDTIALNEGDFHQVRTENHPSLNILLCYFDKHIRPQG